MRHPKGRRRLLKSGPAIKRQRRFASAEGTSWGGTQEGAFTPSRKGGSGKFLCFRTSAETILMHFETIFTLETPLIL